MGASRACVSIDCVFLAPPWGGPQYIASPVGLPPPSLRCAAVSVCLCVCACGCVCVCVCVCATGVRPSCVTCGGWCDSVVHCGGGCEPSCHVVPTQEWQSQAGPVPLPRSPLWAQLCVFVCRWVCWRVPTNCVWVWRSWSWRVGSLAWRHGLVWHAHPYTHGSLTQSSEGEGSLAVPERAQPLLVAITTTVRRFVVLHVWLDGVALVTHLGTRLRGRNGHAMTHPGPQTQSCGEGPLTVHIQLHPHCSHVK